MGLITNLVTAGDYKNANIKVKGMKNDKVFLIHKSLLGKQEIRLDKSTVADMETKSQSNNLAGSEYQVEIRFKNGKRCLATLTDFTYRALNSSLY